MKKIAMIAATLAFLTVTTARAQKAIDFPNHHLLNHKDSTFICPQFTWFTQLLTIGFKHLSEFRIRSRFFSDLYLLSCHGFDSPLLNLE